MGVRVGAGLADTRAALPALMTLPVVPDEDRSGLVSLARWCGRYGPARHVDGEDGLWIDITGVAHLFASTVDRHDELGERGLLVDLVGRFSRFGLTARVGLADTLGTAHAVARFATTPAAPFVIVPSQQTRPFLASLPVAALRLDTDAVRLLERLGLRRIGQLYNLPRAALERRFRMLRQRGEPKRSMVVATVLRRLDQALAETTEPRAPLMEIPDFVARLPFSDPLVTATGIETALDWLCCDLAGTLEHAGVGGRRFRLVLYRTDGTVGDIAIGTSASCRDPAHICRLLREKIADFDAGFGIDLMTLDAGEVARLGARQQGLAADPEHVHRAAERLVDRLSGRLGGSRVMRLRPHASHIPEAAQKRVPALGSHPGQEPLTPPLFDGRRRRPILLFDPPEPITVLAAVPEGAPLLITWRRVRRRIVYAEGPERIAPAWWEHITATAAPTSAAVPTRDYYVIEEATGARYWVFRAGLYAAEPDEENIEEDKETEDDEADVPSTPEPRWFMHGILP